MTIPRRLLLAALPGIGLPGIGLPGIALPGIASAQPAPWPAHPLRLVVAWPPGGGVDTPARLIAGPMGLALGQPVVVENRGGASGSIGCAAVAQAAPDGLTLLADASPHAANATLLKGLSFGYASAFAPLTQLVVNPLVLVVNAAVPARTLAEFVAWVKAQPQPPAYASSGIAAAPHQAAALWLQRAGLRATHVPYRGSAPAMAGLLAGETAFTFSTLPQAVPLVQDGRLRALAVASAERLPNLAEVPTVAEQGFPGFVWNDWVGLWTVAGTPPAVLARLHAAAVGALREPAVVQRLAAVGQVPLGNSPAEFGAFVAQQRQQMAALVRDGMLTAE